ncbi:hypothetical protein JE959_001769 [Aeromonas veronii]|nr:hypothetical protein [Aeromonas veronii]
MKRLFVINEHTLCVGSGDIQFRACSQDTIAAPLIVLDVREWSNNKVGETIVPKECDLIRLATEQETIDFIDNGVDKELEEALNAQKEQTITASALFELEDLLYFEFDLATADYSRTFAEFHSVKSHFSKLTSQFEIVSDESNKHGAIANSISLTEDSLGDEAQRIINLISSAVDSIKTSYLYQPVPEKIEELTALTTGRLQRLTHSKETQEFISHGLIAYTWLLRRHAIAVEIYQLMIRALHLKSKQPKQINSIKRLAYDHKVVRQVLTDKGHSLKSLPKEPNLDLMESEAMTTAKLVADIRAWVDGYNSSATWTQLA